MRVGIVILPEYRWWMARSKWEAAEEYGFDHAWTYDHLGWRTLVDGPWFDAVPTLTAAAMVTERIKLGTFVASPNFRHPVAFVRQVTALDDIADGRLILGVGAGGAGHDAAVTGAAPLTPAQRFARYGEFVELLDLLLRQDSTTWSGDYYTAVEARSAPGSVRRPRTPFALAANGPKSMRLVARYGQGWITTGKESADDLEQWWRGVGELSARLDDALGEQDRHPGSVDRYLSLDSSPRYSLTSVECFTEMLGRARDLGFTDVVVHWPRGDGVYAGQESVLEQIAADVLPGLESTPKRDRWRSSAP
jgi:alkanesulfonate monooxygenase SsuD/methylene tetrahydromethanopterin reductase-like flavin-dependent oxidoreductase (luciferase family)